MRLIDADAINDPEIREVYRNDIMEMSRRVQQKFGVMAFLFPEGDPSNVVGFYQFRIWSLDKEKLSKGKKL